MADEDYGYTPFLRQIALWPSEKRGETVAVHEMAPGYAINALHKLIAWATPAWGDMEIRRTPLAMALLRQAVGEEVVYTVDLPEGPAPDEVHVDRSERPEAIGAILDLETCFDALTVLADNTTIDTHPVTRARVLLRALTSPL